MCLWSHVSAVTQLPALTVTITYALIQMVKKIVRSSSSSSLLLCVGVCCGMWCVVVCGVVVCVRVGGVGVHGILCVCVCLYICGSMKRYLHVWSVCVYRCI